MFSPLLDFTSYSFNVSIVSILEVGIFGCVFHLCLSIAWQTDLISCVTSSATPTFSISFMINLDGLSEDSSSAFPLQACLIFCLSIVLGSGSVWLWSSLPSRIIKSSRSVLQRQAHVFSTHLHSLEFWTFYSFGPGFPRLGTNFSMLTMWLNEQIYQVT